MVCQSMVWYDMVSIVFTLIHSFTLQKHKVQRHDTFTYIHTHIYKITSLLKRIPYYSTQYTLYTYTMTLDILKMTITMIMCSAFFCCCLKRGASFFALKSKKTIKHLSIRFIDLDIYYRFLLSLLLILNTKNSSYRITMNFINSVFFHHFYLE